MSVIVKTSICCPICCKIATKGGHHSYLQEQIKPDGSREFFCPNEHEPGPYKLKELNRG